MIEYTPLDFIPIHNKILVQPGPPKLIKQKLNLPNPEKNKNKKPTHLHKVEPTEYDVRTLYNVGRILRAGSESPYKDGDYVVYKAGVGSQFDLMAKNTSDEKCPIWLDTYSIYGTLSEVGKVKFDEIYNEYVKQEEIQQVELKDE